MAAEFDDAALQTGVVRLKDCSLICVLNWTDSPAKIAAKLPKAGAVTDLWSSQNYGRRQGSMEVTVRRRMKAPVLVIR